MKEDTDRRIEVKRTHSRKLAASIIVHNDNDFHGLWIFSHAHNNTGECMEIFSVNQGRIKITTNLNIGILN